MKRMLLKLVLLVLITFSLLAGISCRGNDSETSGSVRAEERSGSRLPLARLISLDKPEENQKYSSGELIDLRVSLLGEEVPDSVRYYFDGTLLKTALSGPWNFEINTEASRLGRIAIKLIAYSANKRPHTITRFIHLYSDIVPPVNSYRVLNVFPHDKQAYTQGLVVYRGYLYESTGKEGRSTLRKVDIETGEVLMQHKLDNKFFGEGLTYLDGKFYQLTWLKNTGFVYDAESFTQIHTIHYDTQGWGLTTDGEKLYMSDGTNRIYVLEPQYFTVLESFDVFDNEKAVRQLNELEFIDGMLWANIFTTDLIAKIDPASGKVIAYYDLSGLISPYDKNLDSEEVLNGIAWDGESKRMYVTGKHWSRMFEIELK